MTQVKLTRDSFHVFQANARNALKQSQQVPSVLICAGTGCIAGGALKIYDNLKSECEQRGLKVYVGLKHDTDEEKSLHVKMSGCHGFCEMGPLVHIEPMGVMYIRVKPEDCQEMEYKLAGILGRVFVKLGNLEKALEWFRFSVEGHDDPDVRGQMALACSEGMKQDPDSALYKDSLEGMEYLAKYVRSAVKDKDLAVIGPADETISRISDRYRKVFYLKHPKREFLSALQRRMERYIEVNPGFRKISVCSSEKRRVSV